MGLSLSGWGIAAVFAHTFLGPFAGAAEPPTLPLPQEIDYAMYIRGHLLTSSFSTDPTLAQPRVAAEQVKQPLEAFIINYEPCARAGDVAAYRLVVRNVDEVPVENVVAQFRYPDGVLIYKEGRATPAGAIAPKNPGELEWNIGTVLPGHENWREANLTFVVAAPAGGLSTQLTVSGGGTLTLTSHTIPDNCPSALIPSPTALPSKQPAIICDPGEIGCADALPNLGKLFNAVVQQPARQPTVCSTNDPDGCTPNQPQLGVRFAEAVASLLPGECSVMEDAILADPAFHDGLNRRADVAAFFMRPLYDSGQDFSRLVLENEMLGIQHNMRTNMTLREIHTRHWHKRINPLDQVLRGALSTDDIRARIVPWAREWREETEAAQQEIQKQYEALQQQRRGKFEGVAQKAILNAESSIERACGSTPPPPNKDGGLRPLLFEGSASVREVYRQTLQTRLQTYPTTQQLFVDPNNALFPPDSRESTWQTQLRQALDAFDGGDPKPLEQFIAEIPLKDEAGFAAGWQLTYLRHAAADLAADEGVRITNWEIALDTPKTAAAECARDTTLAARIEISWCESGDYPDDYILTEALNFPTIRDTKPPILITGGETAQINPQRTFGVSCGGLPGDPYWAADCSCNCQQVVAVEGNLKFCQATQELEPPPQLPNPSLPEGCEPHQCADGSTVPACFPGGGRIPYFIAPCAGRGGVVPGPTPAPSVPTAPTPAIPSGPDRGNGGNSPTPLPTRQVPTFSSQFQSSFWAGPRPTLPPSESTPPQQPPAARGAKPIIRPDMYSIALAPRTQDECLQEKALDDHFLVELPGR